MNPEILSFLLTDGTTPRLSEAGERRRAHIIAEAERIFGDPAKAQRWLSKPKDFLSGNSPFDVLDSEIDYQSVQSMLVRIEYGMIG